MKHVVGLGNPGEKYKNTRHNVGFLVVELLAAGLEWTDSKKGQLEYVWTEWNGEKIEFVKPQAFMNKSGLAVKYMRRKHPKMDPRDLYVIHDDLDIKLGEYKIGEKGPREHNGLRSIYEQTGMKDFNHVRIGIDGRALHSRQRNGQAQGKVGKGLSTNGIRHSAIGRRNKTMTGTDYVLGKWKPEEREVIIQVIDRIVKELKNVLA